MGLFELLFRGLFNVPKKKKSKGNPFALKGDIRPYRKAMIKEISLFFEQEKYKGIFNGAFFSKFSASFLKKGKAPVITEEDLLEGVNIEEARGVFMRAMSICSLRCNKIFGFMNFKKAGAKYIVLKVSRTGTVDRKKGIYCPKVPEEKKYKTPEEVPLYPCFECDCDPMCDIWYKAEF